MSKKVSCNQKICTKCNIKKNLDAFFKNSKSNWCKDCKYKYARDTYNKKSDLERKYINAKRNFGLEKQDFLEVIKPKKCEICGYKFESLAEKNIDHCHETNIIRGVLCGDCNKLLGYSKDSPKILMSAIKYLMSI